MAAGGGWSPNVTLEGIYPLYDEGDVVRFRCELPREFKAPLGLHALDAAGEPVEGAFTLRDRIEPALGDPGREVRVAIVTMRLPKDSHGCSLRVKGRQGLRRYVIECVLTPRDYDAARKAWCDGRRHAEDSLEYPQWFDAHRAGDEELVRERAEVAAMAARPLVSVVTPVFKTPADYLRQMIDSVLGQTYDALELVVVNVSGECPEVDAVLSSYDDPRLRVVVAENRSISENTNVGIAAAAGDYVAFIDHDDFVEPDALYRYVKVVDDRPDCDLFFCNEDLWGEIDGDPCFCGPKFKPGWNPDLLFTHDYVCHLLMVSRYALDHTERSGADVTGAQDYDLTLKAMEVARDICCVPRVLYHWRVHEESTAINRDSKPYALEAGRLAVQRHFERRGIKAEVGLGGYYFSYRVRYALPKPRPKASIIISDPGDPFYANRCLAALDDHLDASSYEAVVVRPSEVERAWRAVEDEYVVFLGGDCEVMDDGWLDELLGPLMRPEVGCVGSLVLDQDDVVQADGLTMRSNGTVGQASRRLTRKDFGYMTMLMHAHDVSALPGCCQAFRTADLKALGGFDERFSALSAVDLCLRVREAGKLVVVTPYSPIHHWGDAVQEVSDEERALFLGVHPSLVRGDPYVDPAVDSSSDLFKLGR